jgi:hypothetical protein
MQKISTYILNLSSKILAIYLIIYPLIIVIIYTVLSVIYRNAFDASNFTYSTVPILLITVVSLFLLPLLLWLLWYRAIIVSVDKTKLGISIRWFHLAYGLFIFYLVFNLIRSPLVYYLENSAEDFTWIIFASTEVVNLIGLLVCYPIICHYSARAICVYKNGKNATLANSIAFTLLLIFIPICIPFLHNYTRVIKTKTNTLLKIYAIGFGLIILIFIIVLVASIFGIFKPF